MRLTAKADHGHTAGMSMNQKKGGNVTTAEIVTTTATPEVAQAATIRRLCSVYMFICYNVLYSISLLGYVFKIPHVLHLWRKFLWGNIRT